MKVIIAFLMLFCGFVGLTSAQTESLFVGLEYSADMLPNGCKSEGGMLVGKGDDFAVSIINCRDKRYAILDRLMFRDSNNKGMPHWKVVDLVILPNLKKGESINEIDCSNLSGGYTLTIATWHDTKRLIFADHISYALRLNLEKSKFEVLSQNQVKCDQFDENEIRARE